MSNKKKFQKNIKFKDNKASKQQIKPKRNATGFNKFILPLAVVVLATFFSFYPSLKNDFTNWDDPTYLLENPIFLNMQKNFNNIFTSFISCNYHPLTMLSFAMEYKLCDYVFKPEVFHATNVILHLINTLLVFWFIFLLSNKKIEVAFIVSLFFGIHPMHVESVTWIAERKDVLYTMFYLLALITYIKYLKSDERKILKLILVFIFFALSVLAKAVAVTLPVVMLLLDYYYQRKLTLKLILEKIPFLLFSGIMGFIAVEAQKTDAIAKFGVFTLLQRFEFASYGFFAYIYKLFIPVNLSAFYPYPTIVNGGLPLIYNISLGALPVLIVLVFLSLKRTRIIAFGFLFYLITIALVLQFVSVGAAITADRYAYLPYIGLLFMIGMGYSWFHNNPIPLFRNLKYVFIILILGSACIFSYLTNQRAKIWKNTDTLWTDVLNKYWFIEVAHKNRGNYYAQKGMYAEALVDYNALDSMKSKDAKVFSNRGNIFGLQAKWDKSLADYSRSIQLDKNNSDAYLNRAITYSMMKEYKKALEDYNIAIKFIPNAVKLYQNRAFTYLSLGEYKKAIDDYSYCISQLPNDTNTYFFRGVAYFNLKNYKEALNDNNKAIELKPNYYNAIYNRSVIYKILGKYKEALEDARRAKELGYPITDSYIKELTDKVKTKI
ncbi:MAG: tetratricopeptide repeat protein [Bacteroidales bacterium]|nr:tetratricopeptide repeat protein [Bacteroidales bacterium]